MFSHTRKRKYGEASTSPAPVARALSAASLSTKSEDFIACQCFMDAECDLHPEGRPEGVHPLGRQEDLTNDDMVLLQTNEEFEGSPPSSMVTRSPSLGASARSNSKGSLQSHRLAAPDSDNELRMPRPRRQVNLVSQEIFGALDEGSHSSEAPQPSQGGPSGTPSPATRKAIIPSSLRRQVKRRAAKEETSTPNPQATNLHLVFPDGKRMKIQGTLAYHSDDILVVHCNLDEELKLKLDDCNIYETDAEVLSTV